MEFLVYSLNLSKEVQGRIPGIFLGPEIKGPGWDSWYIPLTDLSKGGLQGGISGISLGHDHKEDQGRIPGIFLGLEKRGPGGEGTEE